MTQNRAPDRQGLTLVELAVTLALIGLSAGLAAVTLSSGETDLRSTLRNFRFDVELARHEAITRSENTYIDFFLGEPAFDANGDGRLDALDRCYVVFEDRNGNFQYDPAADPPETIKVELLQDAVSFSLSQQLPFTPLGETQQAAFRLQSAVEHNCDPVSSYKECLVTSYDLSVSSVGRVQIGDKQEACEEISECL